MTKKSETIVPQADDVQDMIEVNRDAMQTALKSYNAWLNNACQVQTEILGFITKRVREDLEMPKRFSECTSPTEVVEHQVSFAQKMFTDYADESVRIMALMSDPKDESGRPPTQ
ncbi:MAG: phasin family protein [Rhizobiales bacterium]|nr:phasin family protein [Hyphomicrobiales bacterium]